MWHQADVEATLHCLRLDLTVEKALASSTMVLRSCAFSCEKDRGLPLIHFVASQTRNLFAQPLKCQSCKQQTRILQSMLGSSLNTSKYTLYSFTARLHDLISAPELSLNFPNANLTFFAQLSVVFRSHALAVGEPWQFEASYSSSPSHLMVAWRKRMRTLWALPFLKLAKFSSGIWNRGVYLLGKVDQRKHNTKK